MAICGLAAWTKSSDIKIIEQPTPLEPVIVTPSPTPTPELPHPSVKIDLPHKTGKAPVLAWGKSHPEWDKALDEGLEQFKSINVNPKDAKVFCPKYNMLPTWERKGVMKQLVSIMAKQESGFKPETSFTECSKSKSTYGSSGKYFPERKQYCIPGHKLDGGVAVSRGLLQISFGSSQSYKCGFTDPKELHDAGKNLQCQLKILDRWIGQDKAFQGRIDGHWAGCARYHSVCRDREGSRSFPAIKAYMQALPECRL